MIELGYRAGLFADMAAIQARYYLTEWGFAPIFESERMEDLAAFSRRQNDRDLILRIEGETRLLGSLVIDGSDPLLKKGEAHLRWFILDETLRGQGLGEEMMRQAIDFLKQNYKTCFLETFAGLDIAKALYLKHGFQLVPNGGERTNWSETLCNQRYEWKF